MSKQYKNAELDKHIDYERFYSRYLTNMRRTGTDKISARCPFHDDQHNSFWFRIANGCWKCEAGCGQGNAVTFLERMEKINRKEAYKMLLKEAGLLDKSEEKKGKMRYTLEDYSQEKKLPLDFLKRLGLKTCKTGVEIPYYDEEGKFLRARIRHHPKSENRFTWGKGKGTYPYGLWKINEAYKKGYIVVVEGESDTHTLWLNDYPALGIPGATAFKAEWAKYFEGLKVYISREPAGEKTDAGQTFVNKICTSIKELGVNCKVFKFTIDEYKDPSGLYLKDTTSFKENFDKILQSAEEIDLTEYIEATKEENPFGIKYNTPQGYYITAEGIFKETTKKKGLETIEITKTPVIISKKLVDIETSRQKVELAYINNNRRNFIVIDKEQIANNRCIIDLSNYGILVNSINAKNMVQYFYDFESANMDKIPLKFMTNKLGWFGNKFFPYEEDILVLFNGNVFEGLTTAGTFQEWLQGIKQFRYNEAFRFMLAASFAAPLLKLLQQRIFLVHLWGDSRSGKTAALKAALSVWGNPEDLIVTFNATKVGLEKNASFYNDLPIGIDERQVANNQEFTENIVYMLSLGKGKLRGSKTGGLQPLTSWHTIILSTGEEPLSSTTSNEGVFTRTIEINLKPFNNEDEARECYKVINNNFGWAGREWIKAIKQNKGLLQQIKDTSQSLLEQILIFYPEILQSHAQALSFVGAVDIATSKIIFGEEKSEEITIVVISAIAEQLQSTEEVDIGQRAYDYIVDMVNSHISNFKDEAKERWGFLNDDFVDFIPAILGKLLEEQGFNPKKVYTSWAEKGLLKAVFERDKRKFQYPKRIGKQVCRVIRIKLPQAESSSIPLRGIKEL
ncbi:DUF927 domain-containing protein [Caldicellulosiruptor morganii]|uniref:DUF927 domain-containing protein n=1 Tax=Caldicellulosiruptor morganii TaxID=1387555 RepID=A0ABY7BLJ5_9FIRM|nr:DUF927 domain-containing protein [Caldicellulosiruptor morganii]WAM33268.1 DUF927 domain-containing protein [Caldicellulosiruptor morganii]